MIDEPVVKISGSLIKSNSKVENKSENSKIN